MWIDGSCEARRFCHKRDEVEKKMSMNVVGIMFCLLLLRSRVRTLSDSFFYYFNYYIDDTDDTEQMI